MKSIKSLLTLFIALMTCQLAFGQSGFSGINYQGVARNTNGTVLSSQAIKVRISILGGASNGPVQYMEEHSLNTNALGLFTLQIGKGTPGTGTFAAIPWQNVNQYAKVEIALGGGSYAALGSTQLMSVPFALYAASGNPGPQGPVGPQGTQGTRGIQGVQGIKGDKGDKGDLGPDGLKGDKGDKGDVGNVGPVGPAGAVGPIGVPGLQGPQGIPGTMDASPASGDLSGNYPNPTVAKLQNKPVSALAPTANQILKFGGASWVPGADGLTLPYNSAYLVTNSSAFSISNTGTSNSAASFANMDAANSSSALLVTSASTDGGTAISAKVVGNSNGVEASAVSGQASGTGDQAAGLRGRSINGYGVAGIASGKGNGVYGISITEEGTGGSFSTLADNGRALYTYGKIKLDKLGAKLGRVLTSDAEGYATWQDNGFILPYTGTLTDPKPLLSLKNNGVGNAMLAESTNGTAIVAKSVFGAGLEVEGDNIAISAKTSFGIAGSFKTSLGIALKTDGRIQFTGTGSQGSTNGKVLTSDEDGYATWQGAHRGVQAKIRGGRGGSLTLPNGVTTVFNRWLIEEYNNYDNYGDPDKYGDFNNSDGSYTIPVNGIYQVNAKLILPAYANACSLSIQIFVNGSVSEYVFTTAGNNLNTLLISESLKLNRGDKLQIALYQNSGAVTTLPFDNSVGSNSFSIALTN